MLIDWFTVGAQALNFSPCVVDEALPLQTHPPCKSNEREKTGCHRTGDADKKKAEAQKESDEFKQKTEDFDKQRDSLMSKAKNEADSRTSTTTRRSAEGGRCISAKRQETLRNDAIT